MADQIIRPLTFDQMFEGVDSTSDGHLISDNAWRTHHNMRAFNGRLQQVPRKVHETYLESCYPHAITALVNLPSSHGDYGSLIAITAEHAWQVRYPSASIKLGQSTGPVLFTYDSRYLRWGTTVYNGQLFFVNEANQILVTDGASVRYVGDDTPKARYITHYFDHLVVGWTDVDGVVMPGRMHWSGLFHLSHWRPGRGNESDFWDFEEDDTGLSSVRGVTGFGKIADLLFVLTPTSIRPVNYVGLPKVFRVGQDLSNGIGNGLPYTLVQNNNILYFFDVNEFNFFAFNGQTVQPIGGPVQGYLEANASLDPVLQQRTWAYRQPELYEIVWVFCSRTSAGEFDRAVCFNYRTGRWHTRSTENIHAFGGRIRRAKGVDELVTPLAGTTIAIGETGVLMPRYWGGEDGALLREEKSTDALTVLLRQEQPVLETKDYHYGNLQSYKEVNTITPHASYTSAKGVYVECSGRDYIDHAVSYDPPILWTPDTAFKRVTEIRRAGRLLRYRFRPIEEEPGGETSTAIPCSRLDSCYGELEISLDTPTTLGDIVPATYVPIGTTTEYVAYPYTAPAHLQLVYMHGSESTFDPYSLSISDGIIAEAREVLYAAAITDGFDAITEPHWVFAPSWGTYAQLATLWPTWSSLPVVITHGWVVALDAFHWDEQTNPPEGYGPLAYSVEAADTLACETTGPYTVTARVRIVAGTNTYSGGTESGFLSTGGTPGSTTKDVIKLTVSNPLQTFYLNNANTASTYLVPIDFTFTFTANTAATFTLEGDRTGTGYTSGIDGQPVVLAGFGNKSNTFARVDFYLSKQSGTSRTITRYHGGGVRGWKWSGFTKNVDARGANK